MENQEFDKRIKVYGIGGLGADKRVFDLLDLNYKFIPIEWIDPLENESLFEYSRRLSKVIESDSDYVILGVSFGGLIAVELNSILNPSLTILISSAETKYDLRPIYRSIGKLGVLKVLSYKFFKLPGKLAQFVFGAKNKRLLKNILKDTDPKFVKWAVNELLEWDRQTELKDAVRIHGSEDKLIPCENTKVNYLINGGQHFMIVDRAREISEIINHEIEEHFQNDERIA